jgi:transposase
MFDVLKNLDLNALPADVREVILAVGKQNAALTAQVGELEALNARLEHFVKELNQIIYGRRSEKLGPDEWQLAFEDMEVAQSEAEAHSDTIEMTKPRKKRKSAQRNLGNLPDHLERIEVVIEPDSITCPCGCGDMICIGEDRTERLEIIPAQPKVVVTIRPKYACPNKQGGIVQALAPVHLIEGGLPTEGTLAHVGVSKYADHCPLFRQSQIYARSGLNIDRSTLANWMGKVSFHLAPVVDHLLSELKSSSKLFMDETRCPVLDPGRGKTKTGYLWAVARDERPFGGTAPPGVVFCYADGRGGKHATEFLMDFSGTLQVDGYMNRPQFAGG